ncbi:hypothetical protein ACFVTE_16465 [Arthrobacter sp. NPDC058097]|uniref:hypothetical protein n=1 Tax=Arthrobacter sp. NPDC058097 TaxID=3346340 RepID=UPI0036D804DD
MFSQHPVHGAAVQGVGPGTSLADKVAGAQTSLSSGDTPGVCTTLSALINQIQAQTGKTIPLAKADELIADVLQIQAQMPC